MNLYFLVEGRRTESKVYPRWLSYLLPEYRQVNNHTQLRETVSISFPETANLPFIVTLPIRFKKSMILESSITWLFVLIRKNSP